MASRQHHSRSRSASLKPGASASTATSSSSPSSSASVYTTRELELEIHSIASTLKDATTSSWSSRITALHRLQSLLHTNGASLQYFDNFPRLLSTLKEPLDSQLNDLRSAVVRETCQTLILMGEKLGQAFESCVEYFLPRLFKLLSISIAVIKISANECIRALLQSSVEMNKPLVKILEGCQTKSNASLRLRCMEYILLLLEIANQHIVSPRYESQLQSTFLQRLNDKNDEVRQKTRQAICAYIELTSSTTREGEMWLERIVRNDEKMGRLIRQEQQAYRAMRNGGVEVEVENRPPESNGYATAPQQHQHSHYHQYPADEPDSESAVMRSSADRRRSNSSAGVARPPSRSASAARHRHSLTSTLPSASSAVIHPHDDGDDPASSMSRSQSSASMSRGRSRMSMTTTSTASMAALTQSARASSSTRRTTAPASSLAAATAAVHASTSHLIASPVSVNSTPSKPRATSAIRSRSRSRGPPVHAHSQSVSSTPMPKSSAASGTASRSHSRARSRTRMSGGDETSQRTQYVASILEQTSDPLWSKRVDAFHSIQSLFTSNQQQQSVEQSPPPSPPHLPELSLVIDRIITTLKNGLNDVHYRVTSSCIQCLTSILTPRSMGGQYNLSELQYLLERLLTDLFTCLSHTRLSIREESNTLLNHITLTFTTDLLCSILINKCFDAIHTTPQGTNHSKVRLGILEYLHYLIPLSGNYFATLAVPIDSHGSVGLSNGAAGTNAVNVPMRSLLTRITPFLSASNSTTAPSASVSDPKTRKMTLAICHTLYQSHIDSFLSTLRSLPTPLNRFIRRTLSETVPELERKIAEFNPQYSSALAQQNGLMKQQMMSYEPEQYNNNGVEMQQQYSNGNGVSSADMYSQQQHQYQHANGLDYSSPRSSSAISPTSTTVSSTVATPSIISPRRPNSSRNQINNLIDTVTSSSTSPDSLKLTLNTLVNVLETRVDVDELLRPDEAHSSLLSFIVHGLAHCTHDDVIVRRLIIDCFVRLYAHVGTKLDSHLEVVPPVLAKLVRIYVAKYEEARSKVASATNAQTNVYV